MLTLFCLLFLAKLPDIVLRGQASSYLIYIEIILETGTVYQSNIYTSVCFGVYISLRLNPRSSIYNTFSIR